MLQTIEMENPILHSQRGTNAPNEVGMPGVPT